MKGLQIISFQIEMLTNALSLRFPASHICPLLGLHVAPEAQIITPKHFSLKYQQMTYDDGCSYILCNNTALKWLSRKWETTAILLFRRWPRVHSWSRGQVSPSRSHSPCLELSTLLFQTHAGTRKRNGPKHQGLS